MTHLDEIKSQRDTRHFYRWGARPSNAKSHAGWALGPLLVWLNKKYYLIKSKEIKKAVKLFFSDYDTKASNETDNEQQSSLQSF
jgi:nicotinate-nucleotide--dimethylbenzimidazole phosphoribosyltransferase